MFFSIIIPVKSINDYIRETVSFIFRMQSDNWELFILPNEPEVNEWGDERIHIIATGKVGPADKRDIGAKKSIGDILVFLDDDSFPSDTLLQVAEKKFKDDTVAAIGGPGITPESDSFWQKVSGAVFSSKFTGGAPERYHSLGAEREVDDWPSVNLMVRRYVFEEVGGFNSKFWPGEDTKLCTALLNSNRGKILYVPDLIVWHHRRGSIFAHLTQVGAYGLHRGYFARRYRGNSLRLKYFIPSALVVYTLTCFLTYVLSIATFTQFSVGFIIYGLFLLLGAIEIARRNGLLVALATQPYIVSSHIYYGIKFLMGFFRKRELVSRFR